MSIALDKGLILFAMVIFIILIMIQAFLSTKKNIILGLIMPLIFLIIGVYNLYMEFFTYNPNPTMKRAFYETFAFSGFLISLVILFITRIIIKRHRGK